MTDICPEYTKLGHHANGLKIAMTANAQLSPNSTVTFIAHGQTKSIYKSFYFFIEKVYH
jgi:hypothetical protein